LTIGGGDPRIEFRDAPFAEGHSPGMQTADVVVGRAAAEYRPRLIGQMSRRREGATNRHDGHRSFAAPAPDSLRAKPGLFAPRAARHALPSNPD